MKKGLICFVFVFLIIGVLSVGIVKGVGMNSKSKSNCIDDGINTQKFNPIGCNCITGGSDNFKVKPAILEWARSNYEFSAFGRNVRDDTNYYCYVDDPLSKIKPGTGGGKGHVRMCTEDSNSTYTTDYTGGEERNKECSSVIPFCEEDKYTCNECRENGDCSKSLFATQNLGNISSLSCFEGNPSKVCSYCVHLGGSGGKKIVFVVGELPPGGNEKEIVEGVFNSISSTEPFKYLYKEKNAFTFSYVPLHSTIITPREVFDDYNSNFVFSTEDISTLLDFVQETCGQYSIVVYLDYSDGATGGESLKDSPLIISRINGSESVVLHEFGHKIGDLGDEYLLGFPRTGRQAQAVNIDKYPSTAEKVCSNFNDYGIPSQDCFPITSRSGKAYPQGGFYFAKSTIGSIMNLFINDPNFQMPRFNVISCAGILNKVLGWDIKEQGVPYCSDTLTPEGYAIYPGIIPQGIDACEDESKASATKSKKCYCDDDPQELRWQICKTKKGKICCEKPYEECSDSVRIPGSSIAIWENKNHCQATNDCTATNKKKICKGEIFDACCDINDVCTTTNISTSKGPKQIPMCQPKECSPSDPTYCDTGANGVSFCCEAPRSDCVSIPDTEDNTKFVKYCMAKTSDCKAGEELCPAQIKICCPTGKCDADPDGLRAFCK